MTKTSRELWLSAILCTSCGYAAWPFSAVPPENFGEVPSRSDVILIAQVIDTRDSDKGDGEILCKTTFRTWAVLKGTFPTNDWIYEQKRLNLSVFTNGIGNPPEYAYFSSIFRDEYLVFLKKEGERYEPVTGSFADAFSFRPLESIQPNLVEIRAVSTNSVDVAGRTVAISDLRAYLEGIGIRKPGRGIRIVGNEGHPIPREMRKDLIRIAKECNCSRLVARWGDLTANDPDATGKPAPGR